MATLKYLLSILKLSAKIMAAGTVCSGAVEALVHTSTAVGLLLSWTGIMMYVAYSTLPGRGYECTQHVAPRMPVKRAFKGVPMRLPTLHELPVREAASEKVILQVLPLKPQLKKA